MMGEFIDSILKIIGKAGKQWLFWLIITICCLPLGFIFGYKWFSVSGSFCVVLIILLVFNFIKYIKDSKQTEHETLYKTYSIFKNLWNDERELLIELFLNKTAKRSQIDFPVDGSWGIRSDEFYYLISERTQTSPSDSTIIKTHIEQQNGEWYNCFYLDEDFRLTHYKSFQKLYKQNKEIVNR